MLLYSDDNPVSEQPDVILYPSSVQTYSVNDTAFIDADQLQHITAVVQQVSTQLFVH